jgi:transposase
MAQAIVEGARQVVGGVDTHGDIHAAAALDGFGRVLATASFAADASGYVALTEWLKGFGRITAVGVEGTGAYGTGLARHLAGTGVEVVEVNRPNRQARRQHGKSDPLDAIEAARAVLAERGTRPKSKDGAVEAIRCLMVAKRSARQGRSKALVQMRHLVYTAPEQVGSELKGRSIAELVRSAAAWADGTQLDDVVSTSSAITLSVLARRVQGFDLELRQLDELIAPLVELACPSLLGVVGVGPDTAAALLVTAGDNPDRLRSEAAWAHLCGVSPLEASSGKVVRHRLDRGGDRRANSALWRVVVVRLTCDPDTRAYVERRLKEGKSKREILRILKRYVARQIYRHLRPA